MNILVFNCGSSSLSFKVYQANEKTAPSVLLKGKGHRVGVTGSEPAFIEFTQGETYDKQVTPLETHRAAAALVYQYLATNNIPIDAVGHRFVHGGSQFATSAILDKPTLTRLRQCLGLAPLHNPISMAVIDESIETVASGIPQFCTFDTAFHSPIPEVAHAFPLPKEIRKGFGFRKFGFHGLSYTFVTTAAADFLNLDLGNSRIVAAHLGTGGSSVAAIKNGESQDTSMGYSPLAGLVMSTRSGDMDPMLMTWLIGNYGYRADALEQLLNKKSGLLGLSEFSSDLRDIIGRIEENGQESAELALEMYCLRLTKYIGSYIAVLGGIDALIFTDDIGITNPLVRKKVCEGLQWAGISFDETANKEINKDKIVRLTTQDSPCAVLSVPTDEEVVIVWEGVKLLQGVKQ